MNSISNFLTANLKLSGFNLKKTRKMSSTETKVKNKQKDVLEATSSKNLEEVLEQMKKLDNTCSFITCKAKITNFAINCKFCLGRFCTSHALPEIHGCGEAVRREERREFMHPHAKLTQEKHSQAQTKLNIKKRQMELARKPNQGTSTRGKKK